MFAVLEAKYGAVDFKEHEEVNAGSPPPPPVPDTITPVPPSIPTYGIIKMPLNLMT